MKKVMIMMAVIAMAIASQAASFKWTASNVYGSDGSTKWTGVITLYATGGELADAVAVTTFTPATAGAVSKTFSDDSLVGGTTYNFYMVVEDNGKTFTSTTKAVAAQATSTQNIAFGSLATATQNADNWKGGAVPEPTTGLLILLGMAGLALKRKVA